MRWDVVTLFPEMFGALRHGVVGRAMEKGTIELETHDLRAHGLGRYRQVDDSPYGGGPGMILRVEPVVEAVKEIEEKKGPGKVVVLSASGEIFSQQKARALSTEGHLILVVGRYEGIDARVTPVLGAEELSIGGYVLSGGELPAMVVIDAVSRLVPGVLGEPASLEEESFEKEGLLEYPQYTRPTEYEGYRVPDVLLSGNHAEIEQWRREEAKRRSMNPES